MRAHWQNAFAQKGYVTLNTSVDGMPIIGATFEKAADIEKGAAVPDEVGIAELLDPWVNVTYNTQKKN